MLGSVRIRHILPSHPSLQFPQSRFLQFHPLWCSSLWRCSRLSLGLLEGYFQLLLPWLLSLRSSHRLHRRLLSLLQSVLGSVRIRHILPSHPSLQFPQSRFLQFHRLLYSSLWMCSPLSSDPLEGYFRLLLLWLLSFHSSVHLHQRPLLLLQSVLGSVQIQRILPSHLSLQFPQSQFLQFRLLWYSSLWKYIRLSLGPPEGYFRLLPLSLPSLHSSVRLHQRPLLLPLPVEYPPRRSGRDPYFQ